MFVKGKSPLAETLSCFAGVWGVPSQRFRISEKDILKYCWPELSERSDNSNYRNILNIWNIDVKPHKYGKVHDVNTNKIFNTYKKRLVSIIYYPQYMHDILLESDL